MKKILFSYQPPIAGKFDIYLVGDFNNWKKNSLKMQEDSGIYKLEIQLNPGKYKYYFLKDNQIILDPKANTVSQGRETFSLLNIPSDDDLLYIIPIKLKNSKNYEEISIVGDFNNWLPNANQLHLDRGFFKSNLFLPKGQYQYKYLAKGDRWYNEKEANSQTIKESHDNISPNSVIKTSATDHISINPVLIDSYDSNDIFLKDKIIRIYRYYADSFEFKILVPNFPQLEISLYLNDESHKLVCLASTNQQVSFHTIIKIQDLYKIYKFSLILKSKDLILYANQDKLSNNKRVKSWFRPYSLRIIQIDSSLHSKIIYQIMPDRFANGDSSLNPHFQETYYQGKNQKPQVRSLNKNEEYYHLADWNDIKILKENPYSAQANPDWFAFYGGDLKGIQSKISYLKELGISLIYLNPIFTAKSPHRYDSIDFRQIDPHLGGNPAFKELVDILHQNEIKVIIDIALNHCGYDFFAFKDCREKGDKSKYWKWFDWYKWPLPKKLDENFIAEDYYQCWWGVKDLPEFNYDLSRGPKAENMVKDIEVADLNHDLVNYLLVSMKIWLTEYDIDGFRLDVPEEVPFWFWQVFRDMVKGVKADAYLVGEVWNDPQEWLQGEYFDGIMNYHFFKDPLLAYFFNKSTSLSTFIERISSGLLNLPWQSIKSQMNLLASHDTLRLRSLAKDKLARLKLALIFQFTFIGIPHIYYGDEVFLAGEKDPDNRRPFPWNYETDEERLDLLDFYKNIIKVRKDNPLLWDGYIEFIEDEHLLIYKRWSLQDTKEIIIIINRSNLQIEISSFINQYPISLFEKIQDNQIPEYGYYVAKRK
jgi:glycosidase